MRYQKLLECVFVTYIFLVTLVLWIIIIRAALTGGTSDPFLSTMLLDIAKTLSLKSFLGVSIFSIPPAMALYWNQPNLDDKALIYLVPISSLYGSIAAILLLLLMSIVVSIQFIDIEILNYLFAYPIVCVAVGFICGLSVYMFKTSKFQKAIMRLSYGFILSALLIYAVAYDFSNSNILFKP